MRALGRILWSVLALALLLGPARAQTHGVGSSEVPGQGAHAWVAVQESDETWRLVHLPPRGFGENAAKAGQVRPVVPLASPPTAMVASGDRVYLIYQDDPEPAETDEGDEAQESPSPVAEPVVRVFSTRALPVWGGYWSYEPVGEFRSHPSIPTEERVLGGAPDGVGGLIVALAGEAGTGRMVRLEGDAWSEAPWTLGPIDPEAARVGSDGVGPRLLPGAGDGAASVHWFGGRRVLVERADGAVRILVESDGSRRVVASLDGVEGVLWTVPIRSGGGRLVLLTRADGVTGAEAFELIEVALATGEVMFRGTPVQVSPISATEFRIFAAMLIGFTVVLLLLTFRPGLDPASVIIPKGLALADPGRRFFASSIDLLLVAGLVGAMYDTPVSSIVTGTVIFQSGGSWAALPMTLLAGGLLSAMFECTLAGTPGKLLTGCRVTVLGEVPKRPSLARALLRNGVKWLVPPIAALAMLDPQARHRGDDLARAAVVVRARPAGDEDEAASDPGDD